MFKNNIDDYVIDVDSLINSAMKTIEKNSIGVVFVTKDNKVVGSLTDGDIRRHILSGGSIYDTAGACCNFEFVWIESGYDNEKILKMFDNKIKHIPVLKKDKSLNYVASKDTLKVEIDKNITIKSRAPARITFSGGGSDVNYYFKNIGVGAVVNAAISKYSYVTLSRRTDEKIVVSSYDLKMSASIPSICHIENIPREFSLLKSVINLFCPKGGFELHTRSDIAIGSGLGGSSSMCVALIGAFNEMLHLNLTKYQIANFAYHAERNLLGIAGGWQDQYASVFGGVNYIEFKDVKNVVYPLRIEPFTELELQCNIFLCSTGLLHDSNKIHIQQEASIKASKEKQNLIKMNVTLCEKLKDSLLTNNLSNFASILDRSWYLKKKFSSQITNRKLNKIYEQAKLFGASAGKLIGAGAGGYFMFYVAPNKQNSFLLKMAHSGFECTPIVFDRDGLQTWTES